MSTSFLVADNEATGVAHETIGDEVRGSPGRSAHAAAMMAKHAVARALPHPVYRMYRKRRVARQIRSYSARIVSHDYGGHRLNVLITDPMAEAWYDRENCGLGEIDELVRMGALRPGATVFELGAHHGIVALILAAELGPSGKIVALEAEPHNAATARKNVDLNGAANVTIVHAAIAEHPGRLYFAEGLNGHVDTATRFGNVEVEAMTIDQLVEQHGTPDLVFIDVEGYEGKALEGATTTLGSGRTIFFVEVHATWLVDCTVADLVAQFAGYTVFYAEPAGTGLIAPFARLDRAPRGSRFFLLAVPEGSGGRSR